MAGLVGKDLTEVMVQYGQPAGSFDMPDGRKAFQWRVDSSYMMPTTTTYTAYGNIGTAYTTGGGVVSGTCFYTLYGEKNRSNSYTITSFAPPPPGCE